MDAVVLLQSLINPHDDDLELRSSLREDVTLRVWRWDGSIATRGRQRVVDWVREEWHGWPDASLEVLTPATEVRPDAVQFRIQATENACYVEHNRALFVTYQDALIQGIDLYCGEPIFSAHRKGYIAPAALADAEVRALLEESTHGWDVREWVPQNWRRHTSRRIARSGWGDAHPGSNWVGGPRWTAEEADAQIEAIIADHRRQGIGFAWSVTPFDTPTDLCQRLEKHGLLPAGQIERMARLELGDLSDIPANEQLVIEELDGSSDAAVEAVIQIASACFHWTPEQADNERRSLYEGMASAEMRQKRLGCLAFLDGSPVGYAAVDFRFGLAYLAGAATLPGFRGRGVYSTLLKHRLAAARDRGFQLAAIEAGPMSKRVVGRYGFRAFGTVYAYGWMPVMDPEVIKSLVPDE